MLPLTHPYTFFNIYKLISLFQDCECSSTEDTIGKSFFHLNEILGELLFIVNRFRKNDEHISEKGEGLLYIMPIGKLKNK